MQDRMEGHVVEFTVSSVRRSMELLPAGAPPWCREIQPFGDRFDVWSENVTDTVDRVEELLKQGGVEIFSAREVRPSLENVFISLLRREE